MFGDAAGTLRRFEAWQPRIRDARLPVAFTLQQGIRLSDVPFDDTDAIFIGGKDSFQHSAIVPEIVDEALRRGKWVHMGRVNTLRRIRYARHLGCHSFDGTGYKWTVNIIDHQPYLNHYPKEMFSWL